MPNRPPRRDSWSDANTVIPSYTNYRTWQDERKDGGFPFVYEGEGWYVFHIGHEVVYCLVTRWIGDTFAFRYYVGFDPRDFFRLILGLPEFKDDEVIHAEKKGRAQISNDDSTDGG